MGGKGGRKQKKWRVKKKNEKKLSFKREERKKIKKRKRKVQLLMKNENEEPREDGRGKKVGSEFVPASMATN